MRVLHPIAGITAICVLLTAGAAMAAERLVQSSTELRTYVHFKVSNDAVAQVLPRGWVSNPGTGPLQGANMFLALIEGLSAADAEGKPMLHQGKSAVLVVPMKNEQTGQPAAVVVGGFVSDPQAAPGAYGAYSIARFSVSKSSRFEGEGATIAEEDWAISTDSGEKLRFNISFSRGTAVRTHFEPRNYAASKPDFYRIYKADQVTEIVHSIADETKRAKRVEFSASGPQLSRFFDGKEQLVAVISMPAYYRQIFLPE